jgi:hypothetical protein
MAEAEYRVLFKSHGYVLSQLAEGVLNPEMCDATGDANSSTADT